jgi:hypothetical protein
MDIKTLQKKTLTRTGAYLLIIVCVVSICIYLGSVEKTVQEKHDWLKNDISQLSRKLDGLSIKAKEFAEAAKMWEGLSDEQKKLQGMKINNAKDLLDKLKDQYKLVDVKISFSKPDELKEVYISDTIAVVSSEVSIDFKGMTDEFILGFVADILNQFPGYIQVTSLSITRAREVTKGDLEKIATGEYQGLAEGKIVFSWRDLKYKGPAAAATKEKEGAQ